MKKGDFLWSAYRITEKQKAGKARSIKEKQLKNSRSTASRPPVALPSSPSADFTVIAFKKPETASVSGFSFSSWILQSAQATYLNIYPAVPLRTALLFS